ncbi:MAG: ribosome biogenesis GTPase Der [Candidatus Melainabacteria bacterium]|nr:ribosome biogenesis GTPase Der [Candidatus Melainabacteria bacterium]
MKKKTVISIIGRPNVGKSTLVNRLAGKRVAIVGEEAGITRDRNYIDFEWDGKEFTIVDTGGISFDGEDGFADHIYQQAMEGLEQADAVVFMVDVVSGITKEDADVAELLRKNCSKPVYLAVNKVDSHEREQMIYEFYSLGFEHLFPISALHGSHGLGEMLSLISDNHDSVDVKDVKEEIIRVAVVGKPNVGKSSMFNKLLGEERSIVSDISGTTRDAINTTLQRHGQKFELIDTAGLRRKSKVKGEVERFSNIRTTYSIAACDVAVLMIDSTEDEIVTDQDQKIASLIEERGKACVVLINKWDIFDSEVKEDQYKLQKYKDQVNYKLRFIDFAPKEYISATTGQRLDKLWKMIVDANTERNRRISTNLLNKVLADIMVITPPPIVKQKAIKLKFINQVDSSPPQFVIFANYPELIPESYTRFLKSQLRQYFGFVGTPIRLSFKKDPSNG